MGSQIIIRVAKIMSDRKLWDKTETGTGLENTVGGEQDSGQGTHG